MSSELDNIILTVMLWGFALFMIIMLAIGLIDTIVAMIG